MVQSQVYEKAHAKLNVGLRVGSKQDNGLHEISSAVTMLDFGNDIKIKKTNKKPTGILEEDIQVVLISNKRKTILDPRNNNCFKAAKLLIETSKNLEGKDLKNGLENQIEIRIIDRMGHSSGLGGSSADPAAVLRGFNRLLNLNFSRSVLAGIGHKYIGSDVAVCVKAFNFARVNRTGEDVKKIKTMKPFPFDILIVNPNIEVPADKTAVAYRLFDEHVESTGKYPKIPMDEIEQEIIHGGDFSSFRKEKTLINAFQYYV